MPLPVSGAFHTSFMVPARERLRRAIAEAAPRDTEVPVISNVDGKPHNIGTEWSTLLSAQLSSPVRWKQLLHTLGDANVTDIAELGPGGVLTGMAKRTLDNVRTISVAMPEDIDKFLEWIAGGNSTPLMHIEGEHLFATERLVVSPAAGVFTPITTVESGAQIAVGDVLGHVNDAEVRSPFAGLLQSYIAVQGERVTLRQPIAWLRTA